MIIIIIIFLHGLGHLTRSGIDALPSFPGASTISSSSRFVVEIYDSAQKPQTSTVDMTAEKPTDLGNTQLQLSLPTDKAHSRKTKARG